MFGNGMTQEGSQLGLLDRVFWSLFEALGALFMVFGLVVAVVSVPISLLMPAGVKRRLFKPRRKGLRSPAASKRSAALNQIMGRIIEAERDGHMPVERSAPRLQRLERWARRKGVPIVERIYIYRDPSI